MASMAEHAVFVFYIQLSGAPKELKNRPENLGVAVEKSSRFLCVGAAR